MVKHTPVMLEEVLNNLNIKTDGVYLDLTLGRGGHSVEILKRLSPKGLLIAFDKDEQALNETKSLLEQTGKNFKLYKSDYRNFKDFLDELKISKVDGILADLGISSPQIDEANRGFSYAKDAMLDMRMDQSQALSALEVVNEFDLDKLVTIFKSNADVMLPERVAKGILLNRPIKSTIELATIVRNSLPAPVVRKKNPVKIVFQALRIYVNDELNALEEMLLKAPNILNDNGVLAIITFHSIEDRIVKKAFKILTQHESDALTKLPIITKMEYVVKSITPSHAEVLANNRSRSAKLRILKKI